MNLLRYSENVDVGLVSVPGVGEIVTPDQIIQVIVSLGLKIEVPNVSDIHTQKQLIFYNKLDYYHLLVEIPVED